MYLIDFFPFHLSSLEIPKLILIGSAQNFSFWNQLETKTKQMIKGKEKVLRIWNCALRTYPSLYLPILKTKPTLVSNDFYHRKFLPKMCETKSQQNPRCAVVWKLRKFSRTLFWQKIRESNSLLNILAKEVTKELISRNIFQWD